MGEMRKEKMRSGRNEKMTKEKMRNEKMRSRRNEK